MEGDLELKSEGDGVAGSGSQNVRKNIALHLKPQAGKTKSKKTTSKQKHLESVDDGRQTDVIAKEELQLSILKMPPEPIHQKQRLRWTHKVNIVGEKIVDPIIHLCETCTLPILLYGRVIPCKHIFCYDCAKKADKNCPRCHDAIQRVEQSALGTVFVCTVGGTKLGVSGCRRTYLSQRDLQAHIAYRHASDRPMSSVPSQSYLSSQGPPMNVPPPGMMSVFPPHVRSDDLLMQHHQQQQQQRAGTPPDPHEYHAHGGPGGQAIPVMVRSANLITVPLHHDEEYQRHQAAAAAAFMQPISQATANNTPFQMMGQLTMQSPPFAMSSQPPPPGPFSGPPPPVAPHFVVTGPPLTLTGVGLPPGHRPPQQGPPNPMQGPSNFSNPMAPNAGAWTQPGAALRGPMLSGPPRPGTGPPMSSSTAMTRPYYPQ